ncbi:MAG: hypothetical protein K6C14_01280, partial [Eubacterium sp.]|nr:hypothetical protein [Eubacterium sp.]
RNPSFYRAKTVNIKGRIKSSREIKNLAYDSLYYVRVRTYMKVDGKKVFSKWSKSKSFKTGVPL